MKVISTSGLPLALPPRSSTVGAAIDVGNTGGLEMVVGVGSGVSLGRGVDVGGTEVEVGGNNVGVAVGGKGVVDGGT